MDEDARLPRDLLIKVVRRAPMISALREEPLDRRDLKERLEISKSTAHRNTTSLVERGLIERTDGKYELTDFGEAIADIVATFEVDMRTTVRLAPLLDAVAGVHPRCPIDAFSDATVTTADRGDPFGPLARFVSLVNETDTLQMVDSYAVAPTYIDDTAGYSTDWRRRSSNDLTWPKI